MLNIIYQIGKVGKRNSTLVSGRWRVVRAPNIYNKQPEVWGLVSATTLFKYLQRKWCQISWYFPGVKTSTLLMKNQRCVQSGLAASSLDKVEWNSMFSAFWLIIEGAAEEVQQFIMLL